MFVSRLRNKDALVSSLRRHRTKNRAESAAKWSNIMIFSFPHNQHLPFLSLCSFIIAFFSLLAEEPRLLAIAAIYESTMKRLYDSACMCVMFCIRLDDIALACSFHAMRMKSANLLAWSLARENKSTNCRLTDSRQTRERRGTSL